MNFKGQLIDILWKGEDIDEEIKVEILEMVSSPMLFDYLWEEFKGNKTQTPNEVKSFQFMSEKTEVN